MSFKLKLVVVQPILDPLSFSHKFGKFVGIVDSLDKAYKKNYMTSLKKKMDKITEETPIEVSYYLVTQIVIGMICFEEVVHTIRY